MEGDFSTSLRCARNDGGFAGQSDGQTIMKNINEISVYIIDSLGLV